MNNHKSNSQFWVQIRTYNKGFYYESMVINVIFNSPVHVLSDVLLTRTIYKSNVNNNKYTARVKCIKISTMLFNDLCMKNLKVGEYVPTLASGLLSQSFVRGLSASPLAISLYAIHTTTLSVWLLYLIKTFNDPLKISPHNWGRT